MKYIEIVGDLFTSDAEAFVQCISADFACGKGIALQFNSKFDVKNILKKSLPKYYESQSTQKFVGDCISYRAAYHTIFNLVTKLNYYDKPTYETLRFSLIALKEQLKISFPLIRKIAMPQIGCGLDRLNWSNVSTIIKSVFDDMNIEIEVYRLH